MTEHISETIQYAILWPNGNLAGSLGVDNRSARWKTLPNGEQTYLWDNWNDANEVRLSIARSIGYGIGDKFEELSSVAEVRIVTTMTIDATDIDGADEPAGEREPRTWERAEDVPPGIRVKPVDGTGFTWERSSDRLMPNRFVQYFNGQYDGFTQAESLTGTWTEGFVEVLS